MCDSLHASIYSNCFCAKFQQVITITGALTYYGIPSANKHKKLQWNIPS